MGDHDPGGRWQIKPGHGQAAIEVVGIVHVRALARMVAINLEVLWFKAEHPFADTVLTFDKPRHAAAMAYALGHDL